VKNLFCYSKKRNLNFYEPRTVPYILYLCIHFDFTFNNITLRSNITFYFHVDRLSSSSIVISRAVFFSRRFSYTMTCSIFIVFIFFRHYDNILVTKTMFFFITYLPLRLSPNYNIMLCMNCVIIHFPYFYSLTRRAIGFTAYLANFISCDESRPQNSPRPPKTK